MHGMMRRRCVGILCGLSVSVTTLPTASAADLRWLYAWQHKSNVEVHLKTSQPTTQDAGSESPDLDETLAPEAKSAVVVDNATGQVLFEKDAHEKLPMASITKIMTMLLIMEALDSGRIKLTDQVKASEYAASMGGSQIFLQPGESMSVDDMLKGIAMASANDACVAMAEHLSGSAEAFVKQMNLRARQLGMDDTHFVNCNGLPAPEHYSSAHDIAIMSRELLKHESVTKYTSVYSDYLRQGSEHPFWLVNTNKLVRFYEGVDGLKTGYTVEAKYCLSATAKKNSFRVIAVVMGEPKPSMRSKEVSELLNWAFSQYTSKILYKSGAAVQSVKVPHGVPESLQIVTGDTVGVVQHVGSEVKYTTDVHVTKLRAPIVKGQKVGTLRVLEGARAVAEVPLIAGNSVERAGFFTGIARGFRGIITFGH